MQITVLLRVKCGNLQSWSPVSHEDKAASTTLFILWKHFDISRQLTHEMNDIQPLRHNRREKKDGDLQPKRQNYGSHSFLSSAPLGMKKVVYWR